MERPFLRIADHDVRVLRNGREAFPAMLSAIEAARKVVRMEMYWLEGDAVGLRFRDALVAASQRGVDVRVIVDAFGSYALTRAFWLPLRAAGGKVETFRPFAVSTAVSTLRTLLARDHRKVIVADDRSFVGGLNLAQHWATPEDGGGDWRDTALELRGAAIAEHLNSLFTSSWALVAGERPVKSAPMPVWNGDNKLAVVSNAPFQRQRRRVRQAYLWAFRRARVSIDITSAYFSPRPLFLRALAQAVKRGVRVRLLVPFRSDVAIADFISLPLLRWLDRRGVRVFRYRDGILHAKTAVVDGEWCTVGSHNLDGLSWAWNLECNVVVRDRALAAQLTQIFEEDIASSLPGAPGKAGLLERLFPDALRRRYSSG